MHVENIVNIQSGVQELVTTKSQIETKTKMHLVAELQTRNAELLEEDEDEQSDTEIEKVDNTRMEPRLSKYVRRYHPSKKIIGGTTDGPMTRNRLKHETCLVSLLEPKTMNDALDEENWIYVINEEIEQIERNNTWSLVPRPEDKNVIGTKWVFRNKLDENGTVTRNTARLVCKGYAQEEGIDYGETFSPVARLEGVRTMLAYAAYKIFKVYQMDVKSTFFNGIL